MCFSAEADVIAGLVVSGAGVDAIRSVRHRRELALASLPLVFGLHQLIEAGVWWGLGGQIPAYMGEAAAVMYLVIAFALPIMVPAAILLVEPDSQRRRWMRPFVLLGAGVTSALFAALLAGPIGSEIGTCCVEYDVNLIYGGQLTALYVAATCLPLLLASHRAFVYFGAVNLIAVAVLAWLMATAVISLWCAWAAVTSIVIVIHLHKREGTGEVSEPSLTRAQDS